MYGAEKLKGTAIRLCGALAAAAAVPWAIVDKYVLRRPAQGIVFAQKAQ